MRCLIGIDVGTSGVKVIAVGEEGQVLSSSTVTYPIEMPEPTWTQQNPIDWWNGTVEALKDVVAGVPGYEISGISFSGQMHGMVALDENHEVVRPAILWNDQRTTAQVEEIKEKAGGIEGLLAYTNNDMLTGYTGGKILWMKEVEPENYEKTVLIVNPKDYLRYQLTGTLGTDVSDASGFGLFDTKNKVWAWELIDKIGLKRSLFPEVVESVDQVGTITAAAAALTTLPEGTPVYAGGGDAVISTTALGMLSPGKAAITLGTSGVVAMAMDEYCDNPQGLVQAFCNNFPGVYHRMGVTLAAAGSYQWYASTFAASEKAAQEAGGPDVYYVLDSEAKKVPAGSEGLVYLPYLTGERCPLQDPMARGVFFGMTSRHSRAHFSRAVMEGVAFSMRQVYEMLTAGSDVKVSEFLVSGGGSKSPLWLQILSDVFQAPMCVVPGASDGGAYGAALLAGIGAGVWEKDEAMALPQSIVKAQPQAENKEVYEKNYQTYCALYPALKDIYHA